MRRSCSSGSPTKGQRFRHHLTCYLLRPPGPYWTSFCKASTIQIHRNGFGKSNPGGKPRQAAVRGFGSNRAPMRSTAPVVDADTPSEAGCADSLDGCEDSKRGRTVAFGYRRCRNGAGAPPLVPVSIRGAPLLLKTFRCVAASGHQHRTHSAGLKKHKTGRQCERLVPRFLRAISELRQARLPHLVQLGETLHSWSQEIATMWRFTRNKGITEGFHTKMEVLQQQAYGFCNFQTTDSELR